MNCQSAQQLISPYLDQQLTGAEMLAMQRHLAGCADCAAEYRQVCEVRSLLRSLSAIAPDAPLEARIAERVAQGSWAAWGPLVRLPLDGGRVPLDMGRVPDAALRPQRGRRLAGALALSGMALLLLAVPFAPSTGDAAQAGASSSAGVMEADLVQGTASALPVSHWGDAADAARWPLGASGSFRLGGSVPQDAGRAAASRGASVTFSGWSAAPLDDEAVGGYAAGDAAASDTGGH